jgi:hypothetical protein
MQHLSKDDTHVYKQFVKNESFKCFVGDMVYAVMISDELLLNESEKCLAYDNLDWPLNIVGAGFGNYYWSTHHE